MTNPLLTDELASLLLTLSSKSVKLWSDRGVLRYQSPRDSISPSERELLRSRAQDIIALLDEASEADAPPPPLRERPCRDRTMPLTFVQVWWWKLLGKPQTRVVHLWRLSGVWDIAALQGAFSAMVCRHDALRMRVSIEDGLPELAVVPGQVKQVEVVRFDQIPGEHRESSAKRFVAEFRDEEAKEAGASGFFIRILVMGAENYIILMSWSHFIGDAVSWGIFWEELWTIYLDPAAWRERESRERRRLQFSDFVAWHQEMKKGWVTAHAPYWRHLLHGSKVASLSPGMPSDAAAPSVGRVAITLGDEISERMKTVSQQEQTTETVLLIAALITALYQWHGQEDVVLCCATACRSNSELQRMIGFVSSAIFLRVCVSRSDAYGEVIRKVHRQWLENMKHDVSGALLERPPFPHLEESILFNHAPREWGVTAEERLSLVDREVLAPSASMERLDWDAARDDSVWLRYLGKRELALAVNEAYSGVEIVALFRSDRLPPSSVERFVGNFESLLMTMLVDRALKIGGV